MNRFVTKPNSKCDKIILLALNVLLTMHFSWWIVGQFKNMASEFWWIWLPAIFAYGVVISCITSYWYGQKNSVEHTLSKLTDEAFYYDKWVQPCWHLEGHKGNKYCYDTLIKKAPKLIDKICKATIVPIERRKPLYEKVCNIWTGEGLEIPPSITEKWKKAIVEYKKYEIWND